MSSNIIPFPFRGQKRFLASVAQTFEVRRGDKQKRAYIDKVLDYHVRLMESRGVASELIEREVAFLEGLFFPQRQDEDATQEKRQA
jgi:hypothetical protein